jgi:hypothetical protein
MPLLPVSIIIVIRTNAGRVRELESAGGRLNKQSSKQIGRGRREAALLLFTIPAVVEFITKDIRGFAVHRLDEFNVSCGISSGMGHWRSAHVCEN